MNLDTNLTGEHKRAAPTVRVASKIVGWGMAVPEQIVKNDHFASYLETSDEWISDRTGIRERRWVRPGETMTDLAEIACRKALDRAGITAKDVDGIVFATVTPDLAFPSAACLMQQRLGIGGSLAFDVNAVCSGFIYALVTGDGLIANGSAKNLLVIGGDLFSKIIDPQDRSTCVLFGDGVGAIVLRAVSGQLNDKQGRYVEGSGASLAGIYGTALHADGNFGHLLTAPCGSANRPTAELVQRGGYYLTMNGKEIFKLAVRSLGDVNRQVVETAGFTISDVDYFLTHQANQRIISAVGRQLDISDERVPTNVARFGNTSAASVPILLAECLESGQIKAGDLVALSAFGAGLTWGAVLVRL